MGLVTALGAGAEATWPRLIAADRSCLSLRADLVRGRRLLVGAAEDPLPEIPAHLRRYACRNNALALAAVHQIEPALRMAMDRVGPGRVGIVMGSSTSGLSAAEDAIRERLATGRLPAAFDYVQLEHGGVAEFAAQYTGARGPAYTLSTACSSGAKAVATARSLLALGICDAVVAGGADSLCRLTAAGFTALQTMAEGPSNPFSANRRGLTLGEGAAVFLLTREPGAIELLGVGEASDAHHMSAPEPEGTGAETAMRAALADAGVTPDAVCYLNLHGTGTALNDAMESKAVARVLGPDVPCSSTKPLVGHTLGASGAIELAFCWLVLARRRGTTLCLPPHCWDGVYDPDLPRLRFVAPGERAAPEGRAVVMSNSFGFGGNNSSLVLGGPAPC
jgi:3-oxoacyl-[acyl-carrier-protein] synthase-1